MDHCASNRLIGRSVVYGYRVPFGRVMTPAHHKTGMDDNVHAGAGVAIVNLTWGQIVTRRHFGWMGATWAGGFQRAGDIWRPQGACSRSPAAKHTCRPTSDRIDN